MTGDFDGHAVEAAIDAYVEDRKIAPITERELRALGALRFILAFYEPGQRHLDTEAWKVAEAGARSVVAELEQAEKRRS